MWSWKQQISGQSGVLAFTCTVPHTPLVLCNAFLLFLLLKCQQVEKVDSGSDVIDWKISDRSCSLSVVFQSVACQVSSTISPQDRLEMIQHGTTRDRHVRLPFGPSNGAVLRKAQGLSQGIPLDPPSKTHRATRYQYTHIHCRRESCARTLVPVAFAGPVFPGHPGRVPRVTPAEQRQPLRLPPLEGGTATCPFQRASQRSTIFIKVPSRDHPFGVVIAVERQ